MSDYHAEARAGRMTADFRDELLHQLGKDGRIERIYAFLLANRNLSAAQILNNVFEIAVREQSEYDAIAVQDALDAYEQQ